MKAGSHIKIWGAAGIQADVGDAVQCHAVLSGPMGHLLRVRIVALRKGFQLPPAGSILSGAMGAAAQQKQVAVHAKGQTTYRLVHIHARKFRRVLQGQHIGTVLIQLQKVAAVLV